MNPVFNVEERRMRAGLRVPLFLFLFFLLMSIGNSLAFMGYQYLISLAVLFGFFWFGYRFMDNRVSIKEAGLTLDRTWWSEFGIGSGTGFLVMSLIFLIQWISGDLEISGFAWESISVQFWMIPILLFLIKHLSVGFYEEFMARSYLIPNIKEGFSFSSIGPEKATFIAVLLSSAIFGLLHAGNPNATGMAVLNIIGAGIMLALPYIYTGRLALSVGLHFMWNFAQGGIYGFRVSGTEPMRPLIDIQQGGVQWWTGGAFGPEGGLIGLAGILLALALLLIYIRQKEGGIRLHPYFKRDFRANQESLRKADELR